MSRDKLVALERLQTLDLQIEALRKEAAELPARLSDLDASVDTARSQADAERRRLADAERARHKLETTLAEDRERVKKWEQRLPSLKHPREFAALQREVDGLKKSIGELETNITKARETESALKSSVLSLEGALATRESERGASTESLREKGALLDSQIAELESKRAETKAKVEAPLASTYEMVRKRRPGAALVEARAGSCTGCNRRLAAQAYNALLNGDVSQCPSCGRLVYAAEAV